MNMVATRARVAGSRAAAAFLALAIALVVGLVPHLALAQNRVTDTPLPIASDGSAVAWTSEIGKGAMMSQTVVDGNFAYFCVGSSFSEEAPAKYANKIVQVRLDDGAVTKTADIPAIDFGCRPEVVNGVIYVPLPNGVMTAIRANDLSTLWTSAVPEGETGDSVWSAQGHNAENSIYYDATSKLLISATVHFDAEYKGDAGCVYAVNSETGDVAWATGLDKAGFYWGGATVVDGNVLIGDTAGYVHRFDVETGEELTGFDCGTEINSDVVAYGSKGAIVVDRAGVLHSLTIDPEMGLTQVGTVQANRFCKAAPTIVGNNAFVCGNDGSNASLSVIDLAELKVVSTVNRYTASNGNVEYIPVSADSAPVVSVHSGETYVYFTANYGAGPDASYTSYKKGGTMYGLKLGDRTAYILYDPASGKDANYCMNSPAFDSKGFIYYMNDSGFVTRMNKGITMYRLYNPNSGEHFYTKNVGERDAVIAAGWTYEGVGWIAPATGQSVYRLYNSIAGEHHYTLSMTERDYLIAAGWTYEGVGWVSSERQAVPLYREYNPNQWSCNHNYTRDYFEHTQLIKIGWKDEGIAWYGV